MPKLPVISAKEFLRLLLKYGCIHISTEGSHFKKEMLQWR
jgi:predicted RNA binding protein YcfA (HicA-like mRNA interferase family)